MSGATAAGEADGLLGGTEYERLREHAATLRQRLVVRLLGEVGLRPFELVQVRPGDVGCRVREGEVHYLLAVGADDAGRTAYLPRELARELDEYVAGNDVEEGGPVFDVSPRRIQMLVSTVAERAADATGDPALGRVSSSDLRRYFARRLLVDLELPPGVVKAVGGWSGLGSLDPFVDAPSTGEVVTAFERAAGTGDRARERGGRDRRYRDAIDRLDRAVLLLDRDATVEYANRRYEALTGRPLEDVSGRPFRELSVGDRGGSVELWETVTRGEPWHGSVRLDGRGGEPVEGHTRIAPVDGDDGAPERFVVTFAPGDGDRPGSGGRALERLGAVQTAVQSAGEALAGAATNDDVYQGLCEGLAGSTAYEFAYVSTAPGDQPPVPRTWAGVDEGTVERFALPSGAREGRTLAGTAIEERDVVVRGLPDDLVLGGRERPPRLQVATPIVDGEECYGALCLGSPEDVVGDHEMTELHLLGERVGQVIAAVEHKRLLLADTVIELELVNDGGGTFMAGASAAFDCSLRLEGVVPVEGRSMLTYVTVRGAPPDDVLEYAEDVVGGARLVADYSDESLLEVRADAESLPTLVVDCGGNVKTLEAADGVATLTCEFAPETNVREVVGTLSEPFPATELVAKREVERAADTAVEFRRSLEERLTGKQQSVLKAAYHAGYFDWPRGTTAEDLADSMDVSSPTLHNHLRRAQRKLLAAFFDDPTE